MPRPPFIDAPDWEPFDLMNECPEIVEMNDPAGSDSYTGIGAAGSVAFWIDADRVQAARRRLVGYEWADDASPWQMHRVRPARHPFVGDLFAAEFSPTRYDPQGKPWPGAYGDGPGVEGGAGPAPEDPLKVAVATGDHGFTTRYLKAKCVVQYRQLPYATRADGVSAETLRNVNLYDSYSTSMDALSIQTGGELNWSQGAPSLPPASGQPKPGVPSEVLIYRSKSCITVKWWRVPEEFVLHPADGIPEKIKKCEGLVNKTAFLGYRPGTLLSVGAEPEFYERGWLWPSGEPAKGLNITFRFEHFDPQPAVELEPVPAGSPTPVSHLLGWNLHPYFASRVRSMWYPATRGGAQTDPPLIDEADFWTMFEHVMKPVAP